MEVINLAPTETNKLPGFSSVYLISNGQTEEAAIEKYKEKYKVEPKKIYRWKQYLYIQHEKKEIGNV